jgi:hypothetical protein
MLVNLLSKAATVAMLSFVVSSMLAMGTGLTVSGIIEPLRNARLLVLALLANFVLMPLGAFALGKVCFGSTNRLELDCCCSAALLARRFCRNWLNWPRETSRSLAAQRLYRAAWARYCLTFRAVAQNQNAARFKLCDLD